MLSEVKHLTLSEITARGNDQRFFASLSVTDFLGALLANSALSVSAHPERPCEMDLPAIYRVRDSRVGQWSKPASVMVG